MKTNSSLKSCSRKNVYALFIRERPVNAFPPQTPHFDESSSHLIILKVRSLIRIKMAEKNYYSILGIEKTDDHEEIAKAFRKLSLEHHPLKNSVKVQTLSNQFSLICEAYDVLSNEQTKQIFDEFGERGLRSGVPKKFTGYAFSGDCY